MLQGKLLDAFTIVVGQSKPLVLRGDKNELVAMEKAWGRLCVTLAECDCPSPKTLTVFELYTWLEALEEKYEALKKQQPNATKR